MNLFAKEIVVITLGGALGSVGRFLLSRWIQGVFPYQDLPWGIIVCNVLGCLLIGVLYGVFAHTTFGGPLWRAGLIIGILGGFTTFSSFSVETFNFILKGQHYLALMNISISLFFCLAATAVGFWMIRLFVA